MLKYFGKVHKKSKFLAILEGVFFKFFQLVGANHGGASSDSIECWSLHFFKSNARVLERCWKRKELFKQSI